MDKQLEANMRRTGQVQNLIVRELKDGRFEVANGNHRLRVMRKMGAERAICCNLGRVSEAEAKRVAIETNETSYKSDMVKMSQTLKQLSEEFGSKELAETMPFGESMIEDMVKSLDFSFDSMGKGEAGEGQEKSAAGSGGGSDEDFTYVSFRLPEGVAAQLEAQILRFKKALYPQDDPSQVSYVIPLEAMIQHLAQLPDEGLV